MKYFLYGFGWVTIPCLVLGGFLWLLAGTMFAGYSKHTLNTLQEVSSPNGRYVATSYVDTGGGAAGWCNAEVNIRPAATELLPNEELFAAHCGTKVELSWDSDDQLTITFTPDRADLSLNQKSMSQDGSVQIRYVERKPAVSSEKPH